MQSVVMVGSVNMDLVVRTPRAPVTGENLLARAFHVGLGGKGANPAVALARLGAEAQLVACVGQDDFGRQALAALCTEGVLADTVTALPDVPTGIALIMVDDAGENTILVVPGANEALTPELVSAALAPRWGRVDALMVNFEIPEACVRAVVEAGYAHHVPVIVDAGPPRRYHPDAWRHATVFSPNKLETETLVGHPLDDDASLERAARELLAQGPAAVVLKLGGCGALACTGRRCEWVLGYSVPVVDTTGAGDAFTAGLTLALAEGRPLSEAVCLGNAAGAVAVTRLGALSAMPTRAEVRALMGEAASAVRG